jgi:hypothetical protein
MIVRAAAGAGLAPPNCGAILLAQSSRANHAETLHHAGSSTCRGGSQQSARQPESG